MGLDGERASSLIAEWRNSGSAFHKWNCEKCPGANFSPLASLPCFVIINPEIGRGFPQSVFHHNAGCCVKEAEVKLFLFGLVATATGGYAKQANHSEDLPEGDLLKRVFQSASCFCSVGSKDWTASQWHLC